MFSKYIAINHIQRNELLTRCRLKSGARRSEISEAKGKVFAPERWWWVETCFQKSLVQIRKSDRERGIFFAKQAFGWYDALTTWSPYHPLFSVSTLV